MSSNRRRRDAEAKSRAQAVAEEVMKGLRASADMPSGDAAEGGLELGAEQIREQEHEQQQEEDEEQENEQLVELEQEQDKEVEAPMERKYARENEEAIPWSISTLTSAPRNLET